jgi:predicted DNA-binding transcriptional regulator AlpA
MSASYTIPEWCAKRRTSRSNFYNMIKAGRGPRVTPISPRRRIITQEDDEAWLRERQAEVPSQPLRLDSDNHHEESPHAAE